MGNNQELVITLAIFFSSLSLIASLLTLVLIRRLKKWNGYIQLVVSLTVCQIVYDVGFLPLLWFGFIEGQIAYAILNTWGGLTSTLWSNVIILVTCRIVVELRTIDIMKKYNIYCVAVYLPSTAVTALTVVFLGNVHVTMVYFAMRTFSIAINVFAICIIFFKIYRMRTTGDTMSMSSKSNPVFVLSMRLVYYCAVQTITRIGNSWYQLEYGFGAGYDANDATIMQTVLYFSEFILTPSAGIGYLIVFLCIQPDAYVELKNMCCCCCASNNSSSNSRRGYSHKGTGRGYRGGKGALRRSDCDTVDDTLAGDLSSTGGLGVARLSDPLLSPSESLLEGDGEVRSVDEEGGERASQSSSSLADRDSSSRESLFPMLDMDEDDLAREIDRIYAYTNIVPSANNNSLPWNKS
jgi:hypothetical protein